MTFTEGRLEAVHEATHLRSRSRFEPGRRGKVAVLLNTNAKRVTDRVVESISKVVPRDDLFLSNSLDEGRRFARTIVDRRYDTVFAGGGDGTVVSAMNSLICASNEAAHGMFRPRLPDLGILRLGTGNGLAFAFGAEAPLADITRAIRGETPLARPLRLIEQLDTREVSPFGSLGYDAQLLNDFVELNKGASTGLSKALTKSLGGYFYALFTRTIPQHVSQEAPRVKVVAMGRASMIDPATDEEVPLERNAVLFEGPALSISFSTTPYYGYRIKAFPFTDRRNDRFHLRVSTLGVFKLLCNLPQVWGGTLRHPGLLDFLVEGVRIETSRPMPYQSAGDARGSRDGLTVHLSDRSFRVLDHTMKAAV